MTHEQPEPTGDGIEVWPLVVADMHARNALGIKRYRTPLRAGNGRDGLRDLYEEILDAAVYARMLIVERDGK
jgi:hypothetical protein